MEFRLVSPYKPQGDQGTAIEALTRGVADGDKHQVLLGVTGSGKTFTMAKVIENLNRPGADPGAQQDAGGAALSRVQVVLPAQRGRVLRLVLRLLPARGLHSRRRRLHREGSDDQRRARQAAAVGHQVAVRAARLHHRRLGELHLRPGLAGSVLRHAAVPGEGTEDQARRHRRASWSKFSTSAPMATSAAELFACAATSSRSSPPTTTTPIASSCGATRSNRWRRSIRCSAR